MSIYWRQLYHLLLFLVIFQKKLVLLYWTEMVLPVKCAEPLPVNRIPTILQKRLVCILGRTAGYAKDIGYAILSAEGYSAADIVVFAENNDMSLLGVRTIEGFGVMVDNIGHRFVATTAFVTA